GAPLGAGVRPRTTALSILEAQVGTSVVQVGLANPATLRWVAAAALLLIALILLLGFIQTVRDDPPGIQTHWGGFGGGLGGWRISSSLAFLIGAIAFGAMFAVVV